MDIKIQSRMHEHSANDWRRRAPGKPPQREKEMKSLGMHTLILTLAGQSVLVTGTWDKRDFAVYFALVAAHT
jgi:hypothetical protein